MQVLNSDRKVFSGVLRLVVVFFVAFFASGCTQRGGLPVIKIGEIDPLSGKLAKHGLGIHEGIVIAVEETNASGGINGRQIRLIMRDDQSLPEIAYAHAEELVHREKVLAMVGGYVDSLVGVIAEVAKKGKVPFIAAASLQRELTRRGNRYFFRISRLQGFVEPVVGFVTSMVKPKKVAVLYASTPGSTEFGKSVVAELSQKGISVPFVERFRPGLSDFTPIILKMKHHNVDFIISGSFLPDHFLLVRQIRANKYPVKGYLGPWGIAYPEFVSEMKEDANFLLSTCAWNPGIFLPGTAEASKRFVGRFKKRFNKIPNTTNMHGYTAAAVLLDALRRTMGKKEDVRVSLRDEIASTDLTLPMERVVFDENGDPLHYNHTIVQIQNGEFVVVYPKERATGKLIYPIQTRRSSKK